MNAAEQLLAAILVFFVGLVFTGLIAAQYAGQPKAASAVPAAPTYRAVRLPPEAWGGPVVSAEEADGAPRPHSPEIEAAARSKFRLPLRGWWAITDRFGTPRGENQVHSGIDLGLLGFEGSDVLASCDGTVLIADYHATYGLYVVLDCSDGWQTVSAHLSSLYVVPGIGVTGGQTVLGVSGSTGFSTGEHLHFEIRFEGALQDPELYLDFGTLYLPEG
jgi:murein DD-endopeptidase MepM/ murein hydrolase activator NlpD